MKRAAEKRTSMMMNIVIIIAVVFLVDNTRASAIERMAYWVFALQR